MVTASEEELAYLHRPVIRHSASYRSQSTNSIGTNTTISMGGTATAPASTSTSAATNYDSTNSGVSGNRLARPSFLLPRDIVSCATQRRFIFLPGNFVEASKHPQRLAATLQAHKPYLKLVTPLNEDGVLERFHALCAAPAPIVISSSSSVSSACLPARTSSTLSSPSPSFSISSICSPTVLPSTAPSPLPQLPLQPVNIVTRDRALSTQLLRAFRFYADHFAPAVEYHARCHLPPVAASATPSTAPPVTFGVALIDTAASPASWARQNTFFLLYKLGTEPSDVPTRPAAATAAAAAAAASKRGPVRLPPFQDEMVQNLQPPLTGCEHNKWFVFGLMDVTLVRDAPRGFEPEATLELHSHDRIVSEYINYLSKYVRKQDRAASPTQELFLPPPPPPPPPPPRVRSAAARGRGISTLQRPTQSMPSHHFH